MKENYSHLTNEDITKKFRSNFDLVNYAIQLAENMIRTGRDARVKSEIQNRAMLILEEINEGKDHFDEIRDASSTKKEDSALNGEQVQQDLIYEEDRAYARRHSRPSDEE